jgi:plastocyanin
MQNQLEAVRTCTGRCHLCRRSLLGVIAGIISAASLEGPLAAHAQAATDVTINIDNFAFSPAELTISPGTKVTWVNRDDIPHAIAEKGLAFKSKAMDTDETFTRTFDTAGEIDYFCSLHPHMTGRIIVKAS